MISSNQGILDQVFHDALRAHQSLYLCTLEQSVMSARMVHVQTVNGAKLGFCAPFPPTYPAQIVHYYNGRLHKTAVKNKSIIHSCVGALLGASILNANLTY